MKIFRLMVDLQLRGIDKSFNKNGENELIVLKGLSLQVNKGQSLVIKGANGSGKSTLLKIIGGNLKPDRGSVIVGNHDVTQSNEYKRSKLISKVHQNPMLDLAPNMSLYENLTIAMMKNSIARFGFADNKKRKAHINSFLNEYGFGTFNNRLDNTVKEFSGGQKQIVAVLMAIISRPQLFLFDEPTANLDSNNLNLFIDIIHKLKEKSNPTVIIVAHNSPEIFALVDKRVVLNNGQIEPN